MYLRKTDTTTHISWYAWIWWPHGWHTSLNSCTSQSSMEQVHRAKAHESNYFAFIKNTASWMLWLNTMPFQYLIQVQIIETNTRTFFAVHKPRTKWNYKEVSHFFSACWMLLTHNWNKTQTIPKYISFLGGTVSLCVVLKEAYLQRKTSFAHIVNCVNLNVRLKGSTTSVGLYQKGCRKKSLFLRKVILST